MQGQQKNHTQTWSFSLFFALASVFLVFVNTARAAEPTLLITSPSQNQTFTGANITVLYQYSNYTSPHLQVILDSKAPIILEPSQVTGTYSLTGLASGSHTIKLTLADNVHVPLTNPEATASVTFLVSLPSNTSPQVNAGPDTSITLPGTASLLGTANDDGLPLPSTLTYVWSKVSGPGTVTFRTANSRDTVALFSASGSYVLRLTVSDTALTGSDDVAVSVSPSVETIVGSIAPSRLGTHTVPESSGVVASRAYSNIYWMLPDSGNPPVIYAVNGSGATVKSFSVSGASNTDWEDIALDESNNIWIADFGDNAQSRTSYVLYRVPEPNPAGTQTSVSAQAFRYVYPDGKKDAEALFVWQGIPYVVQKRPANARVYKFPEVNAAKSVTLEFIGEFNNSSNWITGADISRDGRRLVLINDGADYHWVVERSASSTSVADFFSNPTKQWRMSFSNNQGEAIGFINGTYDVVAASESGDFWKIPQTVYDAATPPPPPPGDTTPPVLSSQGPSGTLPFGISSTNIFVKTSEASTCRYATAPNTSYPSMTKIFATTGNLMHGSVITGLVSGQSYSYYVRCVDSSNNANTSDTVISFSVSGAAQTKVSFAVIGDYGFSGTPERDAANLVKGWNPDFIITTGDNNYDNGTAATTDSNIGQYYGGYILPYLGTYGSGAQYNRFYPSLGNHDWGTAGAAPYLNYFTLPGNERYYEFSWGDLAFFVIDSDPNEPDGISSTSVQALWLKNALAQSKAKLQIVYFHHAPYSSSTTHGSTLAMRWPFKDWGADLVIAAHDHTYERLLVNGLTYLVVGTGGKSLYPFGTPLPESQVRYNTDYGALLLEYSSGTITGKFYSRVNTLIDTFTIASLCTPNWQCGDWSACASNTQTRACTDLNSCGVIIDKPSESQSCTAGSAQLSVSAFQRQYSFRMPKIAGYAPGVMALDPDAPNEFWMVLFDDTNTGPKHEIAKFRMPATTSNSNTLTDLPTATLIQGPLDVWPRLGTNPNNNNTIGSLLAVKDPDDGTTKLIFGAYSYYDTTFQPDDAQRHVIGVVETPNDLANTKVRGFFALDAAKSRDIASGYLSLIPTASRAKLGGDLLLGAQGAATTLAPYLRNEGLQSYVITLADLLGPTASESVAITTKKILDHDLYTTTADGFNRYLQNDRYNYITGQKFGFVVPGTETVAFIGHTGGYTAPVSPPDFANFCPNNDLGYQEANSCWPVVYKGWQHNPYTGQLVLGAGPGSTTNDYRPMVWLYNLRDFENIASGAMSEEAVQPYGYGKLSESQVPANYFLRFVGGAAYDAASGLLYVSTEAADRPTLADSEKPVVIAFRINTLTTPPPACTPNWQCGSWSVCTNGTQTRTCRDNNNCGVTTNKPPESQTCTVLPPPSTKFAIGDRVQTSENLNVRATVSFTGTLLGTQTKGSLGTVAGGPTFSESVWWWNINYDTGADGWSIEDYLIKAQVIAEGSLVKLATDPKVYLIENGLRRWIADEYTFKTLGYADSQIIIVTQAELDKYPSGPDILIICISNWQCGSWSVCTNGTQTRSCADINNCALATQKPPETQSCAVTEPTTRERLGPLDLVYQGAFRFPQLSCSSNLCWEYGALSITYYPAGDPAGLSDGYPGSLFGTGHTYSRRVSEISIPAPVNSRTYSALPAAGTLQELADIKDSVSLDPKLDLFGGLAYVPAQGGQARDLLYWSRYQYYMVSDGQDFPSLGISDLNLAQTTDARGVWHIGPYSNTLSTFHPTRTSRYIFTAPLDWASQYTGGKSILSGKATGQGIAYQSQGPTLFAFAPVSTANPPAAGAALDAQVLLSYPYPQGQTDFPTWTPDDRWAGGAWVRTASKEGVILVGTQGERGHPCYGEPYSNPKMKNTMTAVRFTMPDEAGTAKSMSVYVRYIDSSPNNQFSLALYSDNSGEPGTLLSASQSAVLAATSWNTIALNAEALAPNTPYWLAYNTNGNGLTKSNMKIYAGSAGQMKWKTQDFGSWPGVFGAPEGQAAYTAYIYLTYTASGEEKILGDQSDPSEASKSYCYDICQTSKGYHDWPYRTEYLFYDPSDLAKVAQGSLQPNKILPYANHSPTGKEFWGSCGSVGGVAFDQARGTLFVVEPSGGPFGAPITHVYKVSTASVSDTSNLANIFFSIYLEGRDLLPVRDIALKFYSAATGAQVAEFIAKPDPITGKILLPTTIVLPKQDYDVVISISGYLKKKIRISPSSNTTIQLPVMPAGDFNSDNIINTIDYSSMNSKWFGSDDIIDINGDGIVNSIDFSILNKNWNKTGD